MENSMEFPQKTKNRVSLWSSYPTPGQISRENCNSKRRIALCLLQHCLQQPRHGRDLNAQHKGVDNKGRTNSTWYYLYVESKIQHKWTYLQIGNRHIENRLVVAKGEGGDVRDRMGGLDWEFGVSRYKLLYTEWINNQVLLYSTGNYVQYPGTNHNEK